METYLELLTEVLNPDILLNTAENALKKSRFRIKLARNPYKELPAETISILVKHKLVDLEYFNSVIEPLSNYFLPFIFEIVGSTAGDIPINNILKYFNIYVHDNRNVLLSYGKYNFWLYDKNIEYVFTSNVKDYPLPLDRISAVGFIRSVNTEMPRVELIQVNDITDPNLFITYPFKDHLRQFIFNIYDSLSKRYNDIAVLNSFILRVDNPGEIYKYKDGIIFRRLFSISNNIWTDICDNFDSLYCNDDAEEDTGFKRLVYKIIKYYTKNGYKYINKYTIWRLNDSNTKLENSLLHSYCFVLNNLIYEYSTIVRNKIESRFIKDNNTTYPNTTLVRLYRGVKLQEKASFVTGSIIRNTISSFLSFSADFETAYKFSKGVIYVLVLDLKKDIYLPLSNDMSSIIDESEILLPLGTQFLINNISYQGKHTYVEVSIYKQDLYENLEKYREYSNNTNIII
jgi:hypothetical protein